MTELSLVASLSALYLTFRLIPTFPMFGIPGATFRAGDFLAPLYGILLGPLLGPLAIAIGTVAGFATGAPPVFLGLDFLPGTSCAAVVGLAIRRKQIESSILNSALILAFLLLPFTSVFIQVGNFLVPYVWLHLAGVALLVSPISRKAAREITRDWTGYGGNPPLFDRLRWWRSYFWQHFRAFLVLAFAGTLAQHVMGGILTQLVVGINFHSVPGGGRYHSWQDFWTFIFWIYPVERSIIALVSALLGSAAIVALKVSRLTQRLPSL